MAQLPLALRLNPYAAFDSFVTGDNLAAVEHVRAVAGGGRADSVWLCGPAGSGRSHLLAAACRAAGDAGRRAMYLAFDPAPERGLLDAVDAVDLIALDDVGAVAGRPDWEAVLFRVFDSRLACGGLLLAADRAPGDSGFALPDLASRAAATALYRLQPLADEDLALAVRRQATLRGLEIDTTTADYLLQRVSRNLRELVDWLDRIDRYALAAQRRVTIPLVRRVLQGAESE
jgi:DnaA family protein